MNNRLIHRTLYCLCFLIILIIVSSCSSNKKVAKPILKAYPASYLIKKIEDNKFDFNDMQAKISIKYKNNKNNNLALKGQIRMQKDSVIWISAYLNVGLEIGRIMITSDSVFFINRANKTYFTENINHFNPIFPFVPSLKFLQSLLIGNDMQIKDGNKYNSSTENNKYKLVITQNEKKSLKQGKKDTHILIKNIWLDPVIFKICKYNVTEFNDKEKKLQFEYSDFVKVDDKYLPTSIIFNIQSDNDINIEIKYSDILVSDKLDFPFNISDKFKRITVW